MNAIVSVGKPAQFDFEFICLANPVSTANDPALRPVMVG